MKTMPRSFARFCCLFGAVVLTWLVSGCEPETIPAHINAESLFTLKVGRIIERGDPYFATAGQNNHYIVVGDATGKMIDFKELKPQTVFTFEIPDGFSGNELTVSYLVRSPKRYYSLYSNRNVPVGSTWAIGTSNADSLPPKPAPHRANLTFANVPNGVASVSSSSDLRYIPDVKPNTEYPVTLPRTTGNDFWLRMEFTDKRPVRFIRMQNVEAGKNYTVDLSKFEGGVIKNVRLKEPISVEWQWIRATKGEQEHNILMTEYGLERKSVSSFTIEYPNDTFNSFNMTAYLLKYLPENNSASDDQHNVSGVFKDIPETLPMVEADFQVRQNANGNFRMTTTGDYDYYLVQSHSYNSNGSLLWTMTGKSQSDISFGFPEVPTQILSKSDFQLKIGTVTMAEFSNIKSYEEYLETTLAEKPIPTTGFYYSAYRTKNLR
ncbi:MAG: hypothetical protein MUD08_13680 [Cytophagales bacterium]|jgi:hypothetical protein|nr:hypothetical protein [Cytophagales bacterium]